MSDADSPARQQYLQIKANYPHAILLFRLGDFYETFDADAELTAQVLDIVLTGRNVGKGQRVPMAGIPYHAKDSYIGKLLAAGHHVAICDQIGPVPAKGLVRREVVRVLTPGTLLESNWLTANRNNYLAVAVLGTAQAGLAYVDISTNEFATTQWDSPHAADLLRYELLRLQPAEVLHPPDLPPDLLPGQSRATPIAAHQASATRARQTLQKHFDVSTLAGLGLTEKPLAAHAAGLLLQYLQQTQLNTVAHLTDLHLYNPTQYMQLDVNTRRNLELTETLRGQSKGSLLSILDRTVTAMGGRLLRQWVSRPLLTLDAIQTRLAGVRVGFEQALLRTNLREMLKKLGDLERLAGRVLSGVAVPSDLAQIRACLQQLPALQQTVAAAPQPLALLAQQIDLAQDLLQHLQNALVAEPPGNLEKIGYIQPAYSVKLTEILQASQAARDWIANLESVERQRSGIKTLKVGFNQVFGYYIEVSRAQAEQVPKQYQRKQTLANTERYTTRDLEHYAALVLDAETQIAAAEQSIFTELCERVRAASVALFNTAQAIARLDALLALAETAVRQNYVCPEVCDTAELTLHGVRHPVVEELLPAGQRFVPNDCQFLPTEHIWVITGPNMSGKSTFLRQVAICVLMAQIGSFVPANSAKIGIVDRIFTRIGAQDEIQAGQSTFMVEMVETANILNQATPRSLLVLDEIGRGTSTYDGVSLAWALLEYLHNHPQKRAKTLFATHYHELVALADLLPGVCNYNVAVNDQSGSVVFLHQIVPGGADRSYGIHVAQLAGLPKSLLQRAQEILHNLERTSGRAQSDAALRGKQLALFAKSDPLRDALRAVDVTNLSPIEAINLLYQWQKLFLS